MKRSRNFLKSFVIIFAVASFFGACSDEISPPANFHYEYFPTDIGHFVIYQVDSVFHDDFAGEVRTYRYQVKERVHSHFIDGEGKQSIRIERFKRQTSQHPWIIKDVWHARADGKKVVKFEENIPFIKLVFPPHRGQRWDGNALNHLPEMIYRITEVHKPANLANGLRFDSTLTVTQNNFVTLINEDIRWEKYALHIGLVEKSHRIIRKNVAGNITAGVEFTYTLLEYGRD